MEFHYLIGAAAAVAAAPGRIPDFKLFPREIAEFNATQRCRNGTRMLDVNSGDELKFSSSFHLSIALSGSLLLIAVLLWVRQNGYTLSERWYCSTDDIMWIVMGLIIIPWSIVLPISTLKWDDCGGKYHLQTPTGWQDYQFWGRMAFAPWLLDGIFLWWLFERFVVFHWRAGKG